MFNLFDVTRSFADNLGKSPRKADDKEVAAYMQWMRQRHGLPDLSGVELKFTESRSGRRNERGHCIGATFGQKAGGRDYENGAYSIIMPGHDMHRARVTFETVDEAGETIASQALPVEPKKGGVIWSREDVRKAAGPAAKLGKVQAAKLAPAPIVEQAPAAPIAVETVDVENVAAVSSPVDAQSDMEPACPMTAETPSGPEIASEPVEELSDDSVKLDPDPIAELIARMDALEARVASLPVESAATPTVDEAKRSPAHERAIRRAWQVRSDARARADLDSRALEAANGAYRGALDVLATANAERDEARAQLDNARRAVDDQREVAAAFEASWREVSAKRKRSSQLARQRGREMAIMARMHHETAADLEGQRQRAQVAEATIADLRRNMVDPSTPERASDIARLVQERDAARNAAAATDARNRQMQSAIDQMAERFEAMATRVAKAEAAARAIAA